MIGRARDTVYFCCVSKNSQVLYTYSNGDQEIENLAALCLEKAPLFHKWYVETINKRTFGYLMENGYVYFAIVDESLRSRGALKFLEHLRDELKNLSKKGLRGSFSGTNSIAVQEQLLPVIRRLMSSLQQVSRGENIWRDETPSSNDAGISPSPSNVNGQIEVASSTRAPLLGKSGKQEKKKMKDHVSSTRDIELEEQRKSTERASKVDFTNLDSSNQGMPTSSLPIQKDASSMRIRSSSPNIRRRWWHLVQIVLAIDAAVCVILFCIWLLICHGIDCIR